ncbi:monooxygenase [Ferrimonas sediminicola]|uniref:Monooxygenase n=1 Tax=Ferrimonas sediminicola TaxID=2569538 RepID=A0A4U1BD80_9GAMM|nr:monooxygenase [Ferrimonas sediminicola]TKB48692.1 monooxygenase [Ferrimonas sediminicola]
MKTLLQVDFPYQGPMGKEMVSQMRALAESINEEPGMVWKIWTQNEQTAEAGGIYLFEDEASARAYLEKHSARLAAWGIGPVNGKLFAVNGPLSTINRAPL